MSECDIAPGQGSRLLKSLAWSASYASIAPALFSIPSSWLFLACKSELPPICFCSMKMFGTLRWPVMSSSASWRAAPSSTTEVQYAVFSSAVMLVDHTNLIQLHQEVHRAFLIQQSLGGLAIWAVAFGEDNDRIFINDLLRLRLCGHDGVRAEGARWSGEEQAAEYGRYLGGCMNWTDIVQVYECWAEGGRGLCTDVWADYVVDGS
jgi:hypothetical protein